MSYRVVPFVETHVGEAARLFAESYDRERAASPLLPAEPMGGHDRIARRLRDTLSNPGVAAFRGGEMVGYLCTSAQFPWKGQRASLCREYAHAATGEERGLLYQLMYAALAEVWVATKSHLHLLCHFASDPVERETLFRLGFGAVVAENLRDLSPLEGVVTSEIVEERHASLILELAREHGRYYRGSPIFLLKAEGDLPESSGHEGDPGGRALFVCREEGKPVAYFVVGQCRGEGEGLLLADTNTAQIMSAYAGSDARGRGIGRALLGTCIEWARRKGYDRLFVEHETANIWGGNFWRRHFSPFLYASMRYVDCSL